MLISVPLPAPAAIERRRHRSGVLADIESRAGRGDDEIVDRDLKWAILVAAHVKNAIPEVIPRLVS